MGLKSENLRTDYLGLLIRLQLVRLAQIAAGAGPDGDHRDGRPCRLARIRGWLASGTGGDAQRSVADS